MTALDQPRERWEATCGGCENGIEWVQVAPLDAALADSMRRWSDIVGHWRTASGSACADGSYTHVPKVESLRPPVPFDPSLPAPPEHAAAAGSQVEAPRPRYTASCEPCGRAIVWFADVPADVLGDRVGRDDLGDLAVQVGRWEWDRPVAAGAAGVWEWDQLVVCPKAETGQHSPVRIVPPNNGPLLPRPEGSAAPCVEFSVAGSGRERRRLFVDIDLDPTPGAGHTAEGMAAVLDSRLRGIVGHYRPVVSAPSSGGWLTVVPDRDALVEAYGPPDRLAQVIDGLGSSNGQRVGRAHALVETFVGLTDRFADPAVVSLEELRGGVAAEVVADMISDLLHLVAACGHDAESVAADGVRHFVSEVGLGYDDLAQP